MRLRHVALTCAVALASLLLLTGCSETDEVADTSGEKSTTMSVTSPFGKVEVPAEPKKALGMYTTDVDMLIALGIPLADQQPIRGDGWTDFPDFFPQEELEGVKPFANYPDYNYEAILAAQPDFILNGLGYDKKVVKRLPEIAPTYSVDAFDGRNWMEHFKETAEALDRTEEYDAWQEKYDARVAEVKKAISKNAGMTVAPFTYFEGKASSACYTGVECKAFKDVGLTIYPGAEEKGGEGVAFSGEQLERLTEVDAAFTIRGPGTKGQQEYDAIFTQLEKNKLFTELPMVKNDRVFPYDMEMTFGSPSGQLAFLDVIEKALG